MILSEERAMSKDDERAIRDLVDTWMAASRTGDLQTVLDLMADDVVFMVPGREPFGKEAFAVASEAMKGVRIDGTSEIRELQILGDWAYTRNFLQMTMMPAGGEPIRRSGYTLTILRKEADSRWRLARDANLVTENEMTVLETGLLRRFRLRPRMSEIRFADAANSVMTVPVGGSREGAKRECGEGSSSECRGCPRNCERRVRAPNATGALLREGGSERDPRARRPAAGERYLQSPRVEGERTGQ